MSVIRIMQLLKLRTMPAALFVLLVPASGIRAGASAQTDTSRLDARLQQLPAGVILRANAAGATVQGELRGVTRDTVLIGNVAIARATLERVWLRERATRQGLKWGALIGAPAGAAFGAFVALIATGLCEYECEDLSAGEAILAVGGGGAAGALAGGALGAAIGAAIPRWVDLAGEHVRIPTAPRAAHVGSISLVPTLTRAAEGGGGGAGVRANYMFQTRHFALGPELGRYSLGERDLPAFVPCGPDVCLDTVPVNTSVFHAGGAVRIGTGTDRSLEPFATAGAGLYAWQGGNGIELGGYSLGAGVQARNRSRRQSLFLEARWQSNLTRSGDDTQLGFYTLGIGAALAW
jgi:hypothetical protein